MPANTNEDAALLETLEQMRNVPCCEMTATGCSHRHGQCSCSCPNCLCSYVAFQIDQGDALVSPYLPELGHAVMVENTTSEGITPSEGSVEGCCEIVALIAPGKVWFPETLTGWLSLSPDNGVKAALLGQQTRLSTACRPDSPHLRHTVLSEKEVQRLAEKLMLLLTRFYLQKG